MKKINLCLWLLVVSTLTTWAQKADKQVKKYAATITAVDMQKHLSIIAGAEMEGRDTPSDGLKKAANYIQSHFQSLGLTGVLNGGYQMPYAIHTDSIASSSLILNGKEYKEAEEYIVQQGGYSMRAYAAEVIFVGYGLSDSTHNDYAKTDVRGKIVMMLAGMPGAGQNTGRRGGFVNKQAMAATHGALAILQVQSTISSASRFLRGGRPYINPFKKSNLPNVFMVNPEIAKAITGMSLEQLEKIAGEGNIGQSYTTELELGVDKRTQKNGVSNVLGYLQGTDLKEEVLVITAHYDHVGKRGADIFYGADDDGSGTVGVLEIAEAFMEAKKAGKGPRRSILFMTVSGEEKGLLGSAYYSDHPVFPLDKTVCNLNIDMIGRIGSEYQKDKDSTNYVYVIGDDKLSTSLRPISETANELYTGLKLDYKYNDPNDPNRFYYRSDHYNFAEKGVPIIFYFNGTHADYHRPTDTVDKINFPLMAKRAQLVFATAWEIANRDAAIVRDQNKP